VPIDKVKTISALNFHFFSLIWFASGTVYLPSWNAHNTFEKWRFSWKLAQWKSYFARNKGTKWILRKHNIYGEWHHTWHNWIKYGRNWWVGHGGRMEITNAYKILLEKSEWMTILGELDEGVKWKPHLKTLCAKIWTVRHLSQYRLERWVTAQWIFKFH